MVQAGTAAGAASPVAPTITGGSGSTWTLDEYQNAGAAAGRVQHWRTTLAAGDLGGSHPVLPNTTGFTTHHFAWFVLPGPFTVATAQGSTSNTGSTPFTVADTARGAILITALGAVAGASAATITYDGATSGSKFQRAPYVNSSGGSTQTDAVHGHHYSSGSVSSQMDYQEYAATDTLSSVLWNNDMNTGTHAVGIVVYQQPLTAAVSAATETDVSEPLTKSKSTVIGEATAVDVAQHIGFTHDRVIGEPAGVDVAQHLPATKSRAVGIASSIETAENLGHLTKAVLAAVTTDTAFALTATKSWGMEVISDSPPIGFLVTEGHVTASRNYPTNTGDIRIIVKQHGVAIATSDWFPLTDTPTLYSVPVLPAAGGTGFTLRWEVRTTGALDPLIEGAPNQPGLTALPNPIGVPIETDAAQHLPGTKSTGVGEPTATDVGEHLTPSKSAPAHAATATDAAQHLPHSGGFIPPAALADLVAAPTLTVDLVAHATLIADLE